MRALTNAERIKLANLIVRDDWKLATEVMEAALAEIHNAMTTTAPDSADKTIASRFRTYVAAKMFYDTYLATLQKEIQLTAQPGTILPDNTEGLFGTRPGEP